MSLHSGDIITSFNEEHGHLIDGRTTALWNLSFWGHPAWIDSNSNTLSTPAVTHLVMYHRMNMALRKLTIAQIIGGVRGVIPESKLAKYGDFRYETNLENMYCNTEDIKEERLLDENREYSDISQQRLCLSKQPLDSEADQNVFAENLYENETDYKLKKSLCEWLNKIGNVLEGAKRIAGIAQPLDLWTEELIKICLRFIYVARINDSLLQIMNSEISFITDYQQLPKDPISRIELLSLPQPQLDEEFRMDLKEIDTLWLKLASHSVRKFWSDQNKILPIHTEESFENQQSSMIRVNFLRRCRQRRTPECPSEKIDVPKDVALELLGSLLQIIEETNIESSSGQSVAEAEHKSYFPQAHGDWTKQLFPRHLNMNPPPDRDTSTAIKRTGVQTSIGKGPIPNITSKVDPIVPPEGLIMPLRFYMCVPPPPLASAMRIQAIVRQQQYTLRQPLNTMAKVSTNHPTPQQVQGKVSLAPMTCIPPQGFIQTPAPINNWNYKCSQRVNTPMQISPQYSRINTGLFYQHFYSKDVSDISKFHSKRDVVRLDNIISRRNEVLNSQWEKGMKENPEIKFLNDSGCTADKLLPQATCETNVRFRLYQNMTRNCNTINPTVYEKCNQQVVSNIYDIKSKQLQIREAGMAMNVNNNGLKFIRLPPLGIQHKLSPRNQSITNFTNKPRFMGGITVNDLKLAQERLFYQKNNTDNQKGTLVENFLLNKQENCATCEEKVEKWLETVNNYMKSGSCVNIEELPSSSVFGTSVKDDKVLCNCTFNGDAESVEWYNNECQTGGKITKVSNVFSETKCGDHCMAFAKCKRKNVRQLLLKQLYLFEGSLKLKKGNDLEGKVKLLKRYFTELNSKGEGCHLKHKVRNSKFGKYLPQNKRSESKGKDKYSFVLGTKREDMHLPSEKYFKIAGFSTTMNEFKILSRESSDFNAFPSKRVKLCSSMSLFLDREPWTYDELKGRISSINYFDMLTDDLFFSEKNPNAQICKNHSMNTRMITGWTHFEIIIKTILENILATLNNQNVRERYKIKTKSKFSN